MQQVPVLVFAKKGHRWVGIREVSSGLKCACTCPACGEPLIAKKGAKNKHHFAHAYGFSCAGALETALHQYAKQLIANALGIQTPAIEAYRGPILRKARWESYCTAITEYQQTGLRYDVLLQRSGHRLAVEVKVSHETSADKIRQATKSRLNVLEIDVGSIYQQLFTTAVNPSLAQLKHAILRHHTHRKWLVNLWQQRYEFRLYKQATKRKVWISAQNGYYHYHVYRCPRRKRFVRSGFREGQSYAQLFQECLHCPCCRKVEYQQERVGFQQVFGRPRFVFCNEECLSLLTDH